jgi:hypothetical protein
VLSQRNNRPSFVRKFMANASTHGWSKQKAPAKATDACGAADKRNGVVPTCWWNSYAEGVHRLKEPPPASGRVADDRNESPRNIEMDKE